MILQLVSVQQRRTLNDVGTKVVAMVEAESVIESMIVEMKIPAVAFARC